MCSSPIVYCNMNAKVMRSVMSFKLSRLCLIQCTSTSVATLLVFVVVLAVRPYCAHLPSRVVIGQSDKSGRIDDLIAERHHQRRQRQQRGTRYDCPQPHSIQWKSALHQTILNSIITHG